MSGILETVKDIYEAMNQGNIGKVISTFDESFSIHLPDLLGGTYRGREGILDVVSKICSSGGNTKKVSENLSKLKTGF
jgi:hypothetical protein